MGFKLRWRKWNLHPIGLGKNVLKRTYFLISETLKQLLIWMYISMPISALDCPNYLKFNRFFVGASNFSSFLPNHTSMPRHNQSKKKTLTFIPSGFALLKHQITNQLNIATVYLIRKFITSEETGTQLSKHNYK